MGLQAATSTSRTISRSTAPARPPVQPGQTPIDWTNFPIEMQSIKMQSDEQTIVPLLVPVVPAGSTGVLEFLVTAHGDLADQSVLIIPGVSLPHWFEQDGDDADQNPDLDQEVVNDLIAGAQSYAQRVLNVDPALFDSDVAEQYVRTQLETVVEAGAAAWVASGGGSTSEVSEGPLVTGSPLTPSRAWWLM